MAKRRRKIRPAGDITADLEPLWFELIRDHKFQDHEVIGLFRQWRETHNLPSEERYEDGTRPVVYYGHQDGLK